LEKSRSGTCGEGGSRQRRQRFRASNGQCLTFVVEAGDELAATTREGHSGHPFLLPLFLCVSSTPPGVSCRPHRLLPPPLRSGQLASPTARPPPPVFSRRLRCYGLFFCKVVGRLITKGESVVAKSSASVCHAKRKKDSLVGRRVRILNFSGQVVASGILMSDDDDNVVMGKKLGGE
ncbi:hypothetical protein Taro_006478, partial [Colocasia esculenta]|nr:hypothetical protein [Colocasia esculenta]